MFKFRYVMPKNDLVEAGTFVGEPPEPEPILQVMQTHEVVRGLLPDYRDIVQREIHNPQWQTVETIYDDAEYDKARGWSLPEPCAGKEIDT